MPWGAKKFSRVSGFKGHSWPAAACRGGSHLLRAALKAAGVTPPPRAGPTPPGARAPGSEGGCARVRSSRRDAAPRCGEEAAVSGSVSEEPEGSSGATARQGPRGGRNRCASAALPPSRRRPGLYLLRPQPRPGTEAQARPPFPAAQAELAGRTDRRTGGPTGASGRRRRACRPPPRRRGHRVRRGREGHQGGRDRPSRPLGQRVGSRRPGRHPRSAPRRRAGPRARPRCRAAFGPSLSPSFPPPPPPPSALSGQPERRRPGRRGVRRGGGGAGGSAGGGLGAADHGAPE